MNKIFSFFKNTPSRVYLDHAGATPISSVAEDALIKSMNIYGNPSGIHKEGVEAGLLLDKSRAMCAKVLNAHAYEIYFMSSGTESCNEAILGTYYGFLNSEKSKDEIGEMPHIITSSIEHPAVLEPIRKLEKEGKIRATYLRVNNEGIIHLKDLKESLCKNTILVSVMYANNEIGTIEHIKEIGRAIEEWKKDNELAHTSYPYFHTDACQAANYCNLDVVRLRTHLMTVNSSKCYGPKGTALLYVREGIRISPMFFGGGQERKLRSGTEAVPLIYSFAVALSYTNEIKEREIIRLQELNDFCRNELIKKIPEIKFYGAFDYSNDEISKEKKEKSKSYHEKSRIMRRLPNNINCSIKGITSEEMIIRLDTLGFAVSHKSACASRESDGSYVITEVGGLKSEALENIRITFGRSTTKMDIERLVISMKEIADKYSIHK